MCRTIQARRPSRRSQPIDVCPARGDHGSHALCRYRRYRVYRPAGGVADSGPNRDDAEVWVLVRRESLERFERLAATGQPGANELNRWSATSPRPDLGLTDEAVAELGTLDHIVHCAAIYDITADEADQRAANVDGTRAVIDLAQGWTRRLHHVSSIAVAGTYPGEFTEDDFDVAQDLPTPYHQTKFEAELLVRSAHGPAVSGVSARGGGGRLAHRRDGQGRRALLLLRRAGEAGACCPGSRRWRCPTPGAPTSFRSTSSRRRLSHSCTRTDATARRSTSRPRKRLGCAASTAGSPKPPGCRRCVARCRGRPRRRS